MVNGNPTTSNYIALELKNGQRILVAACQNPSKNFNTALDMLKQEGLFEKLDCKIAVGQGYRGKSGKLGVGNCTCRFEHFVKGCPPTEIEIYEYLKKYLIQY